MKKKFVMSLSFFAFLMMFGGKAMAQVSPALVEPVSAEFCTLWSSYYDTCFEWNKFINFVKTADTCKDTSVPICSVYVIDGLLEYDEIYAIRNWYAHGHDLPSNCSISWRETYYWELETEGPWYPTTGCKYESGGMVPVWYFTGCEAEALQDGLTIPYWNYGNSDPTGRAVVNTVCTYYDAPDPYVDDESAATEVWLDY